MKCPSCGNEIEKRAKFCPICGARIRKKRKKVWIVIGIIAGILIILSFLAQEEELLNVDILIAPNDYKVYSVGQLNYGDSLQYFLSLEDESWGGVICLVNGEESDRLIYEFNRYKQAMSEYRSLYFLTFSEEKFVIDYPGTYYLIIFGDPEEFGKLKIRIIKL